MADFLVVAGTPAQIGETLSGVKSVAGEMTGPNYTTGGNVFDTSAYFSDECRSILLQAQGTALYHGTHIPDTGSAPATGSIKLFDKDGTEVSNAVDLTGVTFNFIATGTDA